MDCPDNPFYLLDEKLQRFIHRKGWQDLNLLQKKSIKPIIEHNQDCIIASGTATGKTEAAFLPAISYILKEQKEGIRLLYVSPLKALINDQYRRLEEMCRDIKELTITPWHGDVASYRKNKQLDMPGGIILITPESLESLLLNHTLFVKKAFAATEYIVIDEFHAFFNGERGAQLASLMHRIENLAERTIVRLALSATIPDLKDAALKLRPRSPQNVTAITADLRGGTTLALKLHGYDRSVNENRVNKDLDLNSASLEDIKTTHPSDYAVSRDIFRLMRGRMNLVFTNSRAEVEFTAATLAKMSYAAHVPNEFFPHHGLLAKNLREDLEDRLIKGKFPTTAVCTSTLELGIDIGDVDTIGQIYAPMSVASLRQRLGRSGRRGNKAVLRFFTPEFNSDVNLSSLICEETVTCMAMIELLLNNWYEPPVTKHLYVSTLIQQTLSVIASLPHVTAAGLYELLCKTGPFVQITAKFYMRILKSLGEADLITQLGDKSLALGLEGERVVSHWQFFAAFNTVEEYRILNKNSEIGRTPFFGVMSSMTSFLMAGSGWDVVGIDHKRKVIMVQKSSNSCPPLPSMASESPVHEKIRQTMFAIYKRNDEPDYLNHTAKEHLRRGRKNFLALGMDKMHVIEGPSGVAIFPWDNNDMLRTLRLLLHKEHLKAEIVGSHIEIEFVSRQSLGIAVAAILRQKDHQSPSEILRMYRNIAQEKFTPYLSRDLQEENYLNDQCDLERAYQFLQSILKEF